MLVDSLSVWEELYAKETPYPLPYLYNFWISYNLDLKSLKQNNLANTNIPQVVQPLLPLSITWNHQVAIP